MSRDDLYGSGYFLTYRDWQDDPDLKDDTPFPKLLAWEWMVGEARFIEDSSSFLKMGDLSHSVRYMAKCWNWDKSKVSRFIKKLESKGWIKVKNVKIGETPNETGAETRNETVHRVITICNYREIQRKDRGSETPSETSLETPNETILKKEKIKIKKKKTMKKINH